MSLILSGTDGLSDVDGSAATPAIRGTDANTGIFFPAADTIAFAEGGAEVARFDSSGNLRIGTTSDLSAADRLTVVGGNIAVQRTSGITTFIGDSTQTGYAGTITNHSFTLLTNSVERLRLNTSGTVILQGGSTSATGVGITFPATQSASSDANTLDDYEEGTWTPVDGSGASLSFTVTEARYTKIGRMVQCFAQIAYPSTANTNQAKISGLPFTMETTVGGAYGAFTVYTTEPVLSTWLNLSNTATSVAYSLGGGNATNATFSTDNFRLVWIYESV